jgi:hypothetical protein
VWRPFLWLLRWFLAAKRRVQTDDGKIQTGGKADPDKIGQDQPAGERRKIPQSDQHRQDRYPEKCDLDQCPVWPAQREKQRRPEEMGNEVSRIKDDYGPPPDIIRSPVPCKHSSPSRKTKDQCPCGPEQPIGRLPARLFKVAIPRANSGQHTAKPAQKDGPSGSGDDVSFWHPMLMGERRERGNGDCDPQICLQATHTAVLCEQHTGVCTP